jgi:hypothetical protein
VPVGAEISLPGPVQQVDPVPEQGKPLSVQIGHGHVEQPGECLGGTGQQQLGSRDDVVHALTGP